jgi:DNA-binding response OmpR family regulator
VTDLERRVIELEDRVAVLEEALGLTYTAPPEWGLTPTEDRILAMLNKAPMVRRERLMVALYGLDDDPPLSNVVEAHISHMRRKLRPHGVEIMSHKGKRIIDGGYWIPAEQKARLADA